MLLRKLFFIIMLLQAIGTTKLASMNQDATIENFKTWALEYFNVKKQLLNKLTEALVTLNKSLDKEPEEFEKALIDTIADQAYDYKFGTGWVASGLKPAATPIIKPMIRLKCEQILGCKPIKIVEAIMPTLKTIKTLDPIESANKIYKKLEEMFSTSPDIPKDNASLVVLQNKLKNLQQKLQDLREQLTTLTT